MLLGMGRVRVVNFVSLDGVMQSVLSADEDREGGFERGGWVSDYDDPVVSRVMGETTSAAAALLLGRRTYEGFARVWPSASEDEPAVAAMNRMPKYVASRTLIEPTWRNTVVLGADLPSEVERISRDTAGDIVVFGSGGLLVTLAAHDLIDEYCLLVFPLVLGGGKRMFRDGVPLTHLVLRDSMTTPAGVIIATYGRAVSPS